MFDKLLTLIFGSANDRAVKALNPVVKAIEGRESWAQSFTDDQFPEQTKIFKERLSKGETLDDILVDAFALAREAARRVLGERAYPCQLMGSLVLNSGRITEMKTGEGKTLMCVCAAYLNSLTGKGVHIVTVNDYLAGRDSQWMGRVYQFLGQTVGCILPNMDNNQRRAAYACDLTYGTNSEFGFDYLRDNMQMEASQKVQRGFNFCIVDEIDSILIDEARTPLIISGQGEDDTYKFFEVDKHVDKFKEVEKDPKTNDYPDEVNMLPEEREALEGDYKIDEKSKKISFTDKGMNKINEILLASKLIEEGTTVFDEQNFEYVHYFTQALRAHTLYHPDVDYVVRDGAVQIVDEFTGRILEGRRYGDGLHQAIEAKEHLKIAQRNRTLATVTYQNFFRMYEKLSGMTGTAATEAVEFSKIYDLDVVEIPTNRPVARKDEDDEVYLNESDKWNAIVKEVAEAHKKGQPVLIGTVSVEKSEHLSALLTRKGIKHEVLNAKNHAREALIIAEAGAKGSVTVATNMAGRGTDIKLGGNPEMRAMKRCGTQATKEQYEKALAIEKEQWKKDCEEVKNLGGLYVIGSERHESRRIDNQLRGRSGRQGDPGRSKFYISMDDDLMRLFGGEKMKSIMSRIGMEPGEPINHPILNRSMEKAQKTTPPDYFYMAAPSGEEEFFLKGITSVIGRVPFFGGSAADNSIAGNWKVFTDKGVFADGVAVAFFYTDKAMVNKFTGAYRESGNMGIITKVEGHRILKEIDGVPALQKYAEWKGIDVETVKGGALLADSITSPLGVKDRLGDLIAIRHPMNGNDDLSMSIGNKVAEGTAVLLMAGSVDELIASTGETLTALKNSMNKPAGFHLVHCGGRRAGIGDRINEVYDAIKKAAGDIPFIVEFTFGEYGFEQDGSNTCGGLMLSFTGFEA